MTQREDCIEEILKNLKDRRDRKFVRDHLDELDARAKADSGAGTYQEGLHRATKELLLEVAEESAKRRRELQLHTLALRNGRSFLKAAQDNGLSYRQGIEGLLHGTNEQFFDPVTRMGNRSSAEALGLGAQRDWIANGVMGDLERIGREDPAYPGLDKLFMSRKIEDNIFIEKAELEAGTRGNPGRTNDKAALKIAETLVKWDKVEIQALNEKGAWITPRERHIAELHHDPDRLRRAGRPFSPADPAGYIYRGFTEDDRQAWVARTLELIDKKRMFGAQADEAEEILSKMYGGIVAGDHLEPTVVGSEPTFPNVAAALSVSRSFEFKSPEAQLAYMKEFGRFNPTEQWLYTKRHAANRFGLMSVLGPKPKEALEELIAWAKNNTLGTREAAELDSWAPKTGGGALRNRYAVVSGEDQRPIANMANGLVLADMAVQRLSKLGMAVLAMITDNATISRELARQGLGVAERYSSILSGYFRGSSESDKREVARLLGTGILGRLRGGAARFDVMDAQAGTLAKMENTFFKITGFTAITENKRSDAERMMALHFGGQREKAWTALDDAERRTMESFGVGDKEWELLKTVEWTKVGDEVYLTPDIATKLSDDAVTAYLAERGTIRAGQENVAAGGKALDRAREELGLHLWAYFADRGQHAVIEVGARERAMLYQGTQSGSPLNLALRLLFQFKQFPTAMMTRAWGAEVSGGAGRMDKLAGLTELVIASSFFGILTNMLGDIFKGQDPMGRWRHSPVGAFAQGFVRGGSGSILGDFLAGEFNRFGLPASSTVLGPTFGQVDRLAELWSDISHPTGSSGVVKKPQAAGALALRMVRDNTPFANMIYTKAAVDYLLLHRAQEWMNPGYLERHERAMKDKSGIEFWLRPTRVNQIGLAPALGEALGGRR